MVSGKITSCPCSIRPSARESGRHGHVSRLVCKSGCRNPRLVTTCSVHVPLQIMFDRGEPLLLPSTIGSLHYRENARRRVTEADRPLDSIFILLQAGVQVQTCVSVREPPHVEITDFTSTSGTSYPCAWRHCLFSRVQSYAHFVKFYLLNSRDFNRLRQHIRRPHGATARRL